MNKKKSVRMAMVGVIVGIMLNIVFGNSENAVVLLPAAGAVGGLFGFLIDKFLNKNKRGS